VKTYYLSAPATPSAHGVRQFKTALEAINHARGTAAAVGIAYAAWRRTGGVLTQLCYAPAPGRRA
jgi:hypothetical protein